MNSETEPTVERHPFRYAWGSVSRRPGRWPGSRAVSVYAAESEGGFWHIKDEGTMADFLDPEEDADMLATLISLERYTSRAARDAGVAQMLQRRYDARCGRKGLGCLSADKS